MDTLILRSHPLLHPRGVIEWCQRGYQYASSRSTAINTFAGCWPDTPIIRAIELLEGKHHVAYDDEGNAYVQFVDIDRTKNTKEKRNDPTSDSSKC